MSGILLRKKYIARFSGMERYARPVAWLIAGGYLVAIFGSIWLGSYLLSLPVTPGSVLLMAATSIFVATRMRGLQNIVHECVHATFSVDVGDNALIGKLSTALVLRSYRKYRDDHLSHHANNGDYESDADLAAIRKFRLEDPLTPPTVLRHIVTPFTLRHLPIYAAVNLSGRDGRVFQVLKLVILGAIVVFTVLAPLTSLIFVLLPLFFIFPTLNYWTDCFDHAGLVGAADEIAASRNVLAPAPIRLLFFPRNDSYHLVHHLFPQIPARHLQFAHDVLSEDPAYAGQHAAVKPVHASLAGQLEMEAFRKVGSRARKRPS